MGGVEFGLEARVDGGVRQEEVEGGVEGGGDRVGAGEAWVVLLGWVYL